MKVYINIVEFRLICDFDDLLQTFLRWMCRPMRSRFLKIARKQGKKARRIKDDVQNVLTVLSRLRAKQTHRNGLYGGEVIAE